MPLRPPALDDRGFDDLVDELIARIPAHTPEWTNPRPGDPGRTLIELFAWLGDSLLYRANLIPERQRLAFLRLLGIPMRPAIAARGLVALSFEDRERTEPETIRPFATIAKPVVFETRSEVTVLPIAAQAYYKRKLPDAELRKYDALMPGLQRLYGVRGRPTPYVTTPAFPDGAAAPAGFDLVRETIDQSLWLALLTLRDDPSEAFVAQIRQSIGGRLLTVGVAPSIAAPPLLEEIGTRGRIPHAWDVSYLKAPAADGTDEVVDYHTTQTEPGSDTTGGLTRNGTIRLILPEARLIGAPSNDVRRVPRAGASDRPPRIDDPKVAARLVAWLRLRPLQRMQRLSLSWVGINVAEIDQRQTIGGRIVGQSDGSPDQEFQLPAQSVEAESLQIEVEEPGLGYRRWQRIDDLALAGRDDPAFVLDSEAGLIRTGDNLRGRIPPAASRIRVAQLRAGGGRAGNLPPGTLTGIAARTLRGDPLVPKLKVQQSLPTDGGEDAESLPEAEQRIPALFRHRDRAVTVDDYRQLAAQAPGVRAGRVEVLPRFKPHQRRSGVPGVVAVMVLPTDDSTAPPNPRPDRPMLEMVHAYLDARRPLTTELYVIGCEYVPLALGAGITIQEGFGREEVLQAVRDAVRLALWPLVPGGIAGNGWELGRTVRERELEVVVARVPGVLTVTDVELFTRTDDRWRTSRTVRDRPGEVSLERWQLPELLAVAIDADGGPAPDLSREDASGRLDGTGGAGGTGGTTGGEDVGVGIPVVPETC